MKDNAVKHKLSIAFLTDYAPFISNFFTGSHIQMYNLAKILSVENYDVHFVVNDKNNITATSDYTNITLHKLKKTTGIFKSVKKVIAYRKELEKIQPNLVYTRGRSLLCFIAHSYKQKKTVKHIWATNGEDSCEYWKRTKNLYKSGKSFLKKLILYPVSIVEDIFIHIGIRGANIVINQTKYQHQRLRENLGKEGIILPSVYIRKSSPPIKKTNQVI